MALVLVAAAPIAADPTSISVSSVTVTEGSGGGTVNATFEITLSPAPSTASVDVGYATADGTAQQPSDYKPESGTLTFAIGETSKEVTVEVRSDDVWEPDESFTLNVTSPVGNPSGTATIVDDDDASVSIDDPSFPEGNSGESNGSFAVTLSKPASAPVNVVWVERSGTASNPADYEFPSQSSTLTFAPGEQTKSIAVTIKGDTIVEGNETILVELREPSSALGTVRIAKAQGVGTIVDDDGAAPVVGFDPASLSLTEGASGELRVRLDRASSQTISVNVTSVGGTATQGIDYDGITTILIFAPGETSKTVPVTTRQDGIDENDETFTVGLSNPSNASIGAGTATVTIVDDDPLPQLAISGPATVTEPASGASGTALTFTVSLTPASGRPVTVAFGTANGSAQAGSDYEATSGSFTFAPGETSKQFTVIVLGDTINEGNETFAVGLSSPGNAELSGGPVTVTIVDANAPPALGISDATVGEGAKTVTLEVTKAGSTAQTVTVQYAGQTGPNFPAATLGTDFKLAPGTLTFAPGETSKSITVEIVDDSIAEADETFLVVLSSPTPSGVTLTKAVAVVKIVDNDSSTGGGPVNPPPSQPRTPVTITPGPATTPAKKKVLTARVLWAKLDGKVDGRRRAAIRITLNSKVQARLVLIQGKRVVRSQPFEIRAGNRTVFVLLPRNVKKGRVNFQLLLSTATAQRVLKTKLVLTA
jgi:hypothetical protein